MLTAWDKRINLLVKLCTKIKKFVLHLLQYLKLETLEWLRREKLNWYLFTKKQAL